MAVFDISRSGMSGSSRGNRLFGAFANLAGSFAAWNDARVTRNALSRLSDHELDDLGLTRSDIVNLDQVKRRF